MVGSSLINASMGRSSNGSGNQQDGNDYIYNELWQACAGPLVTVPCVGDRIFYFPQGHIDQIDANASTDCRRQMPFYNLPSEILCRVVNVELKAEGDTDEVFAQMTLLPESEEENIEKERAQASVPKQSVVSFCKILTASDTSTHGGFSVFKRHADDCLPQLDMTQNPPAQELVAKDLHGFDWSFRHIYRGNPKRHLLTTGWSTFVNAKKLVAGDAFIFLRSENGELRVGVRRAIKPQKTASASVISTQSMQIGVLASASHAIATGTMFSIYYRPRTSPSEFIVPYDKYMESVKNSYSIGLRFRMKFEGDDGEEERCACVITGVEDAEPEAWPDSNWKHLKVQWVEMTAKARPERVSPWDLIPFSATTSNPAIVSRPKRKRAHHLPSAAESSSAHRTVNHHVHVSYREETKGVDYQRQKSSGNCSFSIQHQNSQPAAFWLADLNSSMPLMPHVNNPSRSQESSINQPVKIFGVNFGPSLVENCVTASDEIQRPIQKPCESGGSGSINAQSCLTHTITSRSCTKVHKLGSALGRSVDLSKFDGYKKLIDELDRMFEFEGGLADHSKGWGVIYTDDEGNVRMVADCLWPDFLSTVRKIYIYPKEEIVTLQP